MQYRPLGKTGLEVSRLGIGLAEIGETPTKAEQVARLLNTALDNGINFLDTAECYGNSEELIGQTVASRRDEFVLATKCGHVAGGYVGEPWTRETITASIERSLSRMRTDHLDLLQLHSCGLDVLKRGEVIEALIDARAAGKTRFIGYSGDNAEARWAVDNGVFDSLQTSFNVVDQRARTLLFDAAETQGMGIIIKRPIANGVWGRTEAPDSYSRDYFRRAKEMAAMGPVSGTPADVIEMTLQFVFTHEPVDTAIVGTRNPDHLLRNIEMVNSGRSLPGAAVHEFYRRFDALGSDWLQLR